MRRPGSIFMMSIVLGALFAALVYRYLRDQRSQQFEAARRAAGGATVEVLVANEEIPIGTVIEGSKVRLAAWPSELMPEGSLRNAEQVVGRVAIKAEIQTVEQLQLPPIIKDIAMTKRGLVLVVGATGSGKSTSLAAMIDHRNTVHLGHIITVEDPIEFVHQHKKSIITQREVGFDTLTFQNALKNTLRQASGCDSDGEVRDTETMEAAITFAETGHLCIGTLHSNNANQAIERIMNFFPVDRHAQIYLQQSLNLRAIISHRLIPSVDGKRVPALEIMLDTPRVKDLIKKAEVDTLKEAMEQGIDEGCQTFDHVLFQLYKANKISLEQALIHADSANNLRLKIKLEGLKGDEAVNALLDKQMGGGGTDAFKIQGSASGNVTPLRKR